MRKNKKGFTLIELLAVLVVLAILALISVPIVLNIIEQSRTKARERSMEGFAKAVESALYVYQMDNTSVTSWKLFNTADGQYIVAGNVTTISQDTPKQAVSYSGSPVVCESSSGANDGLSMSGNKVELFNCKVDGHGDYSYYDGQGHNRATRPATNNNNNG